MLDLIIHRSFILFFVRLSVSPLPKRKTNFCFLVLALACANLELLKVSDSLLHQKLMSDTS